MGKNRDLFYKTAADFGLNTDEIYRVWRKYFHYKKEGGFSINGIVNKLKIEFYADDNLELFNFFIAFGLAVLSEEMEG